MEMSQKNLILGLNTLLLLVAVVSLAGMILQIPLLYTWEQQGLAINYQMSIALLLLSLAYFIKLKGHKMSGPTRRTTQGIVWGCLLGALLMSLVEAWAYWNAGFEMNLENYLVPDSPIAGHLPLFSVVGLFLASVIAIADCLVKPTSRWVIGLVQVPTVLLINLMAFGLIQNLGDVPFYNYLGSVPGSAGVLIFGVMILFSKPKSTLFVSPFFSQTATIRFYAWLFCLIWLSFLLWQVFSWDEQLITQEGDILSTRHILLLLGLFEILLSTFMIGLGLHILGTLEIHSALVTQLKNAFERYAMLAATLSHDLKAPIQTEIDAIEMIQQGQFGGDVPERAKQVLGAVNENNRYELELVLNLVDMLRYDIQEGHFEPQPVEINAIFQDIQRDIAPLAMRREHEIRVHPMLPEEQHLVADLMGVRRVLYNLINNAIQHLPGGGGHIDVSARLQGQEMIFSIQDDGPGIPPEFQQTLFERFSQGENQKGKISSSGLGLYVSRQIVNRHGGRIWVESEPGNGSTFYFTLPLRPAPVPLNR